MVRFGHSSAIDLGYSKPLKFNIRTYVSFNMASDPCLCRSKWGETVGKDIDTACVTLFIFSISTNLVSQTTRLCFCLHEVLYGFP